MNTIAAIAIALKEASSDTFRDYARQSLRNAQVMAQEFIRLGYHLVTGGTDNHMIVLDFYHGTNLPNFDGTVAEKVLDKIGISTSKSTIPDDPNPPFRPSGLRIGTPAMTTRGVNDEDMKQIVQFMHEAFTHVDDEDYLKNLKEQVKDFSLQFPVPSL